MARALLLVDLQNDFCAGGALAVPQGDSTMDIANTVVLPASIRSSPTARDNSMAWRRRSGPIIAYKTAKVLPCIRC